jgi:hypothetical protein
MCGLVLSCTWCSEDRELYELILGNNGIGGLSAPELASEFPASIGLDKLDLLISNISLLLKAK